MRALVPALLLILAAFPARADDDWVAPVTDPVVKKECGECHMAFQPAFLPAQSWNRIMDGLADHFGDDATLSADTAAHIRATLVAQAGTARKYMRRLGPDSAPLRITETHAFRREHNFPDRVWRDPKVVTASNCPACHRGAEQGWYEDD